MTIMRQLFLGVALFRLGASAVICRCQGDGKTVCRLDVVQDVLLATSSVNYNALEYLIIGEHPGWPLKRSLLQFEGYPSEDCKVIEKAYMYVHFAYAHKASSYGADAAPYVTHTAELYVVNVPWSEDDATTTISEGSNTWGTPYLATDGTDAEAKPVDTKTMNIGQPSRFIEFEVTDAVTRWADDSIPDYGLLLKVEDESNAGRDLRFYSSYHSDKAKHAFISIICAQTAVREEHELVDRTSSTRTAVV